MDVLDNVKSFFGFKINSKLEQKAPEIGAVNSVQNTVISKPIFQWSYDGEKNLGAIGPLIDYYLDYEALRTRSWKAYLDSEVAQTILGKFSLWVVGSGLKLQSEPIQRVLASNKITLNKQEFNEDVEAMFSVFCNSKDSDYCGMKNIHQLARKAFLHSLIGGDVLVILRYVNNQITVQLIDGAHVCTPYTGSYVNDGTSIINGIETDAKGKHIAYHVKKDMLSFERIPCVDTSSGLTTAFLVYGLEYRLDNNRGLPLIAAVMQTISQLDRYKEATIGAAEEGAKVVYTVEHHLNAEGTDILANELRRARGEVSEDLPQDTAGEQIANKVAATTNKQTYNMPPGAQMKAFNSQKELYFKDFYQTNINLVCSTVGIPPNVAMSVYDGSYSSSRAAIKEWEHTLNVNRADFSFQFYSHLYAFWLDIQILKNKVQAPGYIQARINANKEVLGAYRYARFVGASVPHIDPLKEVQAARLKLGDTSNSIPLSTVEQETESLNTGESDANIEQYAKELEQSKELGVVLEVPQQNQSI
jgi:capsid protein